MAFQSNAFQGDAFIGQAPLGSWYPWAPTGPFPPPWRRWPCEGSPEAAAFIWGNSTPVALETFDVVTASAFPEPLNSAASAFPDVQD
jgi:hypothetical protein